jgi:hypothetical protein
MITVMMGHEHRDWSQIRSVQCLDYRRDLAGVHHHDLLVVGLSQDPDVIVGQGSYGNRYQHAVVLS